MSKSLTERVSDLVGDSAACDHYGCRCWQAVADLKQIMEYYASEIEKSHYEDLKVKKS